MDQHSLDPFIEPTDVLRVTDSGAGSDRTDGCRFPGVETTEIEPGTLPSIDGSRSQTLAVLDVPPPELTDVLGDVEAIGVRSVCIPAVDSGTDRDSIRECIESANLRVIGPGAFLGIGPPPNGEQTRTDSGENAPDIGEPRGTAIVAESKLMAETLAERAATVGVDVGPVVGLGAEIDVGMTEIVPALAAQERIDLVFGRAETVPGDFVAALREVDTDTPIAISSGPGADFEISDHVSIPGSRIDSTILEQAGVQPVESLEQLLDAAPVLANQRPPDPRSVIVVSNAGGPGVMAADAVGESSLSVAKLADETREAVAAAIPENGSARNPLDLIADSDVQVFDSVLETVLTDPGVGAAVVITAPNPKVPFAGLAETVAAAYREHDVPIVTALMGGNRTREATAVLEPAGIPNYFDPHRAVGALELLANHGRVVDHRTRALERPASFSRDLVESAIDASGGSPGTGSKRLEGSDAVQFLRGIGVESIIENGATGVDLGLWATDHPERGPLVAVGLEEFVATVGDVSVRAVPLAREDAESMLDELRAAPILGGARGGVGVDRDVIERSLLGVSTLLDAMPAVTGVTIPTLTATPDGVRADAIDVTTTG